MEIKRFKFTEKGDIATATEMDHKLKGPGQLKTLLDRDGYSYKIKLYKEKDIEGKTVQINGTDKFRIYLFSPKGVKKVETSRGYRTFYEVSCDNLPEFVTAAFQIGIRIKEDDIEEDL